MYASLLSIFHAEPSSLLLLGAALFALAFVVRRATMALATHHSEGAGSQADGHFRAA